MAGIAVLVAGGLAGAGFALAGAVGSDRVDMDSDRAFSSAAEVRGALPEGPQMPKGWQVGDRAQAAASKPSDCDTAECRGMLFYGGDSFGDRRSGEELRFTLMAFRDRTSAVKAFKVVTAALDKDSVTRVTPPDVGAESVAGDVVDGGTGHGTQLFMRVGTAIAGVLYGGSGSGQLDPHLLGDQARMFADRIAHAED
ncbi:hypothetical protein [Streptomyces sp. NPDC048192]|uniref:hypothetical protein n=1 Tax=Streptomyces sp. NPDC048192 TaxID=3365510 RepID=UPI00371D1322